LLSLDGRGFGVRVIGPPGACDSSLQVGRGGFFRVTMGESLRMWVLLVPSGTPGVGGGFMPARSTPRAERLAGGDEPHKRSLKEPIACSGEADQQLEAVKSPFGKDASGISVGNRIEIESSQVEQNDRSKSLLVTKPAGRLPEGFNLRVDAFGCGVG
jgi:hypothetical protein